MAWFTFSDSHIFFANTSRTFVPKILRSIEFETGNLYIYVFIKFEDYSLSVVYWVAGHGAEWPDIINIHT